MNSKEKHTVTVTLDDDCEEQYKALDGDAPRVLSSSHAELVRAQMRAELMPTSLIDRALCDAAARCVTDMEFLATATDAARRSAAAAGVPGDWTPDASLTGALMADLASRGEQRHDARLRTLLMLDDRFSRIRGHRLAQHPDVAKILARFRDKAACEAHLVARFERGEMACPNCGDTRGCHLRRRGVWECVCGRQIGLRHGTVAARSNLPLSNWFQAIILLLIDPTTPVAQLSHELDIERRKTVSTIARRVHEAIDSDDTSSLLMGLDAVVYGAVYGSLNIAPAITDAAVGINAQQIVDGDDRKSLPDRLQCLRGHTGPIAGRLHARVSSA